MSYPYLARTTLKYKSPHATDLSFAKDETIRVTGSSDDDEDWLVGETLDGSKKGGFPKDFIAPIESDDTETADVAPAASAAAPPPEEPASDPLGEELAGSKSTENREPLPKSASPPPSPKPAAAKLSPSTTASSAQPPSTTASPAQVSSQDTAVAPAGDGSPARQSLKDRLAFFAAAQDKPAPPPVKPKPAAGGLSWSQRQKLRLEQEAKEKEAGVSAPSPAKEPPPTVTPASAPPVTDAESSPGGKKDAGLSAADAASSISKGGSLRERMAALRGAGAFGAPEEKAPPPKAVGKAWIRPPAPPEAEEPEVEDDAPVAPVQAPATEEGGLVVGIQEGERGGEQTEEEQEKARKAAIAARMAKLGTRGPMGMPPPKPARKPTTGPSPTAENVEPEAAPVPAETPGPVSPPASVPIAPIARRTAPPRRKALPSSNPPTDQQTEGTDPPPQVMIADEERPLPRTNEQVARENESETMGRGERGIEGATAAGIALSPTPQEGNGSQGQPVGAVGEAASVVRGAGTLTGQDGPGEILHDRSDEPHEVEAGLAQGGEEKDDIMREAEQGEMEFDGPAEQLDAEPKMVPLHPPAEEGAEVDINAEAPPPPISRPSNMPKDEVELKHDHDREAAAGEKIPSVPARITERPGGPRPLPTLGNLQSRPLPPPPTIGGVVPPRNVEEEDREAEGAGDEEFDQDVGAEAGEQGEEEEEEAADEGEAEEGEAAEGEAEEEEAEEEETPRLPPPRSQPSLPAPLQAGLPTLGSVPQSPTIALAASKRIPVQALPSLSAPPAASQEEPLSPTDTDDTQEAQRRSGIAARMAKLGGIKFGMPPPTFKRQSTASSDTKDLGMESPRSPMTEAPRFPIAEDRVVEELEHEIAPQAGQAEGVDESPDAEAARRRVTLARLRAGGALAGFNMFSGQQEVRSPLREDTRELELQQAEAPPPPVPTNRPNVNPPAPPQAESEEGEEAPQRLPAAPFIPLDRSMPPSSDTQTSSGPVSLSRPPTSPGLDSPASPLTLRRPPVPSAEKRYSQTQTRPIPAPQTDNQPPPSQSFDSQLVNEPAVMMMDRSIPESDDSPPPPPPPGRPLQAVPAMQTTPNAPRRSMSTASRTSSTSGGPLPSPARRMSSTHENTPSRVSTSSQGRPGYNELQQASQGSGLRLNRAAKAMFAQGKKAPLGDGSAVGFVLAAMDNAQIPRPTQAWGQVVFEQESGSVLKRLDEPRPGDVAAFYDARLKGKKGLQSYTQQAGSVEDPLVGIVAEFEPKNKHKLRVLQVDRGVAQEVSYRCDDLKSGKILVYRVGI